MLFPPMTVRRKILFAIAPLVGVLLLGEVAARLLWQRPDLDTRDGMGLAPHPTRIWTLDASDQEQQFAHSFRLDEHGLRMAPLTGAPHRILTVGDSSIFGHGLKDDETLHASLHRAFAARGRAVDGQTAAVPGYTTEQSLRILDEVGWGQDPSLILLGGLWSDNDIEPITDREWLSQLRSPRQLVEWVVRDSRLVEWARFTLEPPPEASTQVTWGLDPGMEGARRVPVEQYRQNLATLVAQARARSVDVAVLTPCNRPLLTEGAPQTGWPWDAYFDALEELSQQHGLVLVRGCQVARSAGLHPEQAFLDEMHPTTALNQAYGDAVADALIAAGWPGSPP